MADIGFLSKGDVWAEKEKDGVKSGLILLGNHKSLAITANTDLKERISDGRATSGQVLDAVAIKNSFDFKSSIDNVNAENFAILFQGDSSKSTVTGATATNEPHIAHLGKFIKTVFSGISAVAVTDVGGITTYVLGTDYNIKDARLGIIEIIAGGAITEGQAIEVDYTYATVTSDKVTPQQGGATILNIFMDGVNLADDSRFELSIPRLIVAPNSEFDFFNADFGELQLEGKMTTPAGASAPFDLNLNVVHA